MNKRHLTKLLGIGAAATLALTACSTGGNSAEGDSGESGETESLGTITLGFLPSWTDGLSTAYLLENQLEQIGYEVEMEELTEAAVLYTALANGDVDMYPSAWSERTHSDYMDEYGEDIEDLGAYYEGAVLTIAVPEYVDIDSIEDLKDNADMFDGKIIGIEPSAGLTDQTENVMIPEYGLEDSFELVTSSTSGMLAELTKAVEAEEPIVVTLWRPYWANAAFPVKDLEDPLGAMGEPEALHFLGTKGFAEEYPEAAELIAGIQLDDEEYGALEDLVVNQYEEGQEAEAVAEWVSQFPEAFDTQVS